MSNEFRLPPPPRHVPPQLKVSMAVGSKIAWAILAFSSIFFWLFCTRADLSFVTFQPPFEEARGTVTRVRDTSARENRTTIYAVDYAYYVRGEAFIGTSYVLGDAPQPGESVTVEYPNGTPHRSRIQGMRRDLWTPWILLLALFPGVCLLVVLFSVRNGLRRCQLLRDGMLTTGKKIDEQPTSMKINKRTVYKMIYEFDAFDGSKQTASMQTSLTEKLRDKEQVLYDPLDPSRSLLISSLPVRPETDDAGNLYCSPAAYLVLILPAVTIALNLFLLSRRM